MAATLSSTSFHVVPAQHLHIDLDVRVLLLEAVHDVVPVHQRAVVGLRVAVVRGHQVQRHVLALRRGAAAGADTRQGQRGSEAGREAEKSSPLHCSYHPWDFGKDRDAGGAARRATAKEPSLPHIFSQGLHHE
jgi:hypothetical protein